MKKNNGITLIALIITIIVMLILVAVTITIAVNGGLFNYAREAGVKTNEVKDAEQRLADLDDEMSTDELIDYYTREWTPLEDWEYAYEDITWDIWGDGSTYLTAPEGCVVLGRYIGDNKKVNIPSKYSIDGKGFDVILYTSYANDISVFNMGIDIESVYISKNVKTYDYDGNTLENTEEINYLFRGCNALKTVVIETTEFSKALETFSSTPSLKECRIYATEVNDVGICFEGNTQQITVKVPANSTTYNTFMTAKENHELTGNEDDSNITIIGF